jgi:c-di-GMP-binding flagellar brake protein YcgR
MTLTVTCFIPPNGHQNVVEIPNVYPDDEAFFKKYGIKVSMEDLSLGGVAVYADTGKVTDREPDELMVISGQRSCHDTLKALRQECEKRFDLEGWPA